MSKILIFSTAYFPQVGGAEVAVKEITDRASDIRFDMITAKLTRKNSYYERIGNVNVYRFGIGWPLLDKYLLSFFGHFYAIALHKKNKYDAIWSIMASYAGFTAVFFKFFYKKIPFLLTLQEGDDLDYINKKVGLLKDIFRQIFLKADYIQCISNFLADWARRIGADCPIKVVPNAVDTTIFLQKYSDEELNELKKQLDKKNDDRFVITTSRLVLKNAIDDVIKALEKLPNNVKFLILGIGPDKKKLKELSNDIKVNDRVKFLGYIEHKDLPKYLKVSDIFIRPSLSEGLGNSFLEAMAAEIPVIATPVGGIPDFLIDEETGFFCEVRKPSSIAEKINFILNNRESVERVVVNAKEMVLKKYDWNIIARDMRYIFKEIININL